MTNKSSKMWLVAIIAIVAIVSFVILYTNAQRMPAQVIMPAAVAPMPAAVMPAPTPAPMATGQAAAVNAYPQANGYYPEDRRVVGRAAFPAQNYPYR